jgi:hypothetical protein
VARRDLPTVVGNVRVFLADTRDVAALTTDAPKHGSTSRDALLCLSNAKRPLLDPRQYAFPVSRRDGFSWHMSEQSHMHAYLGHAPYKGSTYYRSHEGVDIDMHEARGARIHPLVAIEDGVVEWVAQHPGDPNQACVLLRSRAQPHIAYVYMHLNRPTVAVHAGQELARGDHVAYIWGDEVWGHLHFAVVHAPHEQPFEGRYRNLLNCFPHLYELWHGDLDEHVPVFDNAVFTFGEPKQLCGNKLHRSAYTDVNGYGWRLGEWCPARAVERGAVVRRTLYPGTAAEARNPEEHFDFAVRVVPGTYEVQARVGNAHGPSWQEVAFNGVSAGTFDLRDGGLLRTPARNVAVPDGLLVVRLRVRGEELAGITELQFRRQATPR